MSKAILIIDMPSCCNECKIRFDDEYSNWCPYDNPEPNGVFQYVENRTKPKWCPLKLIPKKREEKYAADVGDRDCGFIDGWNACIDEILWQ